MMDARDARTCPDGRAPLGRLLASGAASLDYSDLPGEVIAQARRAIFDSLGAMCAGARSSLGRKVLDSLAAVFGCSDAARIPGTRRTSSPAGAAFASGFLAEVYEVTDGYKKGGCHPGSVVVPAALAAWQAHPCGGRDLMAAIVAGYETMMAASEIAHPTQTWRGFAPTGTCGALGAAAAASRILGLDAERTSWALGAAGFLAPLSLQAAFFGHGIKPAHAGAAATAGVQAAFMAAAGIDGPQDIIEGEKGLVDATCADEATARRVKALAEGLRPESGPVRRGAFRMMNLYFKPYPSCRHTHGGLDAILTLRARHTLEPDRVERVVIGTYALGASIVGREPVLGAGGSRETAYVECQFSLPYLAAAALADGELGLGQLSPERMSDPALWDLASRIAVCADPDCTQRYPEATVSRATVFLRGGGSVSERVDCPRGDPGNPMSDDELVAKFARLAACGAAECPRLVREVWDAVATLDVNAGALESALDALAKLNEEARMVDGEA